MFGAMAFTLNSVADEAANLLDEHPTVQVLMAQQSAWNKGDLGGFMQAYWPSEELIIVGPEAVTKGWEEALARYELRYPDTDTMGTLKFEVLDIVPLQTDFLWMIGTWELRRATDRPNGRFTLLWQRIDDEWLIIGDHSS
jgi:hypothetical protein